jgi:hypothetical protein
MVEYEWVFAGMFVLAVLQLVVFVYLHKRQSAFRKENEAGGEEESGDRQNTVGISGLRCPSCGAVNDAEFQYCRKCVTQL